ncbi:predicted protein [Chaetoceros tenuissimus]|uniref:F-box domain-containing protein n=1 Tax=Chaetoceros tenuissimus TaxID=426638 RepID=A0AAD3DET3_9STRA|nr:predicted protein [Chaetoceros tenuissimus]
MAPLTRGKRQQAEENGLVVLLKKRKDPEQIIRSSNKHKKLKRQEEEQEASTYEPFTFISIDLLQHIMSFIGTGKYIFLASVSKEFRATLLSMPENDFKTEPSSYIHSWKLTRWIMKVPKNSPDYMRPEFAKTCVQAVKYDSLKVFQNLLKRSKMKPGADWKSTYHMHWQL